MAKDPREQQETDAERIPAHGAGKLDEELDQVVDTERARQERPEDSSAPRRPQA